MIVKIKNKTKNIVSSIIFRLLKEFFINRLTIEIITSGKIAYSVIIVSKRKPIKKAALRFGFSFQSPSSPKFNTKITLLIKKKRIKKTYIQQH